MALTARALITEAYYLTGIVGRDFETATGSQLTDGVNLLNEILALKAVDLRHVPFFQAFNFTAIIGQEKYFIPNMVDISSATFNIDTVRYSIAVDNRKDYFGAARVDSISSLPYKWHAERVKGGMDFYVYFLPEKAYPMELWGKFALSSVDANTDLELTYEEAYLVYLRYELASFIADFANIPLPIAVQKRFHVLEQMFVDISPIDFTLQKRSTLQQGNSFNYGQANLGRGWTV